MLANLYAKFRGSTYFLVALVLFIAGWILTHHFYSLDSDWGLLNLILSVEASVSVALLIMANDKQERAEATRQKYIVDLLESQVTSIAIFKEVLLRIDPDAVFPSKHRLN